MVHRGLRRLCGLQGHVLKTLYFLCGLAEGVILAVFEGLRRDFLPDGRMAFRDKCLHPVNWIINDL